MKVLRVAVGAVGAWFLASCTLATSGTPIPTDSGGSSNGGGGSTVVSSGGNQGAGANTSGSSNGPSSSSVANTSSSSTGAGTFPCPTSEPNPTESCGSVSDNTVCEYGSDAREICRREYTCNGGAWTRTQTGACSPAIISTCVGDPPISYCPGWDPVCQTVSGILCMCPSNYANWDCETPSVTCPSLFPNFGQTCSIPGLRCDYVACGSGMSQEVSRLCQGGVWIDNDGAVASSCPP